MSSTSARLTLHSSTLPSEPRLDIRPGELKLDDLLSFARWIQVADNVLSALQRLLVGALTLPIYARDEGAGKRFLLFAREVLVDALAQLRDTKADLLGIVGGEDIAGSFTGVGLAGGDGGRVVGVRGDEGGDGVEEVLR